ncbi:hypothetical protein P4V72_20435 [Bacillus thuringiensis]|uniref:Uncharacterized protein n=1 Tax=Bacillus thuringiensis TaxID=1428 RepID=A0A9W3XHA6_BACTU|nr:hypothetical protein [Bacillus thuringiensis]AQY36999.1 hypothetical protein B4918_02810 [Bacillus thuringiensis]MDR4148771.1 hypothetical protein [Bacillus thuringiensis]MEC3570992.1 hypothetical protein [Bacillus thuringiensis]MED2018526.1 hypothetical protein [Bacillus thuringiensis]MED2143520.1 hypothetical protein [Bacillus thuringiensis]
MNNFTTKEVKMLRMLYGNDFELYGTSNSSSDFTRMDIPTIAKALSIYVKEYYKYANYPAEFTGSISDLRYFLKDAKLDFYQFKDIFESSTKITKFKDELKKNNIRFTYIGGSLKLQEF